MIIIDCEVYFEPSVDLSRLIETTLSRGLFGPHKATVYGVWLTDTSGVRYHAERRKGRIVFSNLPPAVYFISQFDAEYSFSVDETRDFFDCPVDTTWYSRTQCPGSVKLTILHPHEEPDGSTLTVEPGVVAYLGRIVIHEDHSASDFRPITELGQTGGFAYAVHDHEVGPGGLVVTCDPEREVEVLGDVASKLAETPWSPALQQRLAAARTALPAE